MSDADEARFYEQEAYNTRTRKELRDSGWTDKQLDKLLSPLDKGEDDE